MYISGWDGGGTAVKYVRGCPSPDMQLALLKCGEEQFLIKGSLVVDQ